MNMRESQLDTTNVALKILNDGAAQDLETFFVTSWAIWHSRNQKVFEDVQLTKFGVLQNTIRWEYKEAVGLRLQKQNNEVSRWEAPPSGMYKINVNGATSNDGRPSSVGVIIWDNKGKPVAALSKVLQG